MGFYATTALINAIAVMTLGSFVFSKNIRGPINRRFATFTFTIAFWSWGYFLWQMSQTEAQALLWCRVMTAGAIFIPITFFHLALSFIYLEKAYRIPLMNGYIFSSALFLLNFTPLVVKGVLRRNWINFQPQAGSLHILIFISYIGFIGYSSLLLYRAFRTYSGLRRIQIKYIFLGCLIGFVGGLTNFPLWYNIKFPPLGNFFPAIGTVIMAYVIIKYRMMETGIVLTRKAIFIYSYILLMSVLFGIASWKQELLRQLIRWSWVGVFTVFALILGMLGTFFYINPQRKRDATLLSMQRKYHKALRSASQGMILVKDLQKLLDFTTYVIARSIGINYIRIFLYEGKNGLFKLESWRGRERREQPDVPLDKNNPLVRVMIDSKEPLHYEEIRMAYKDKGSEAEEGIMEQMRALGASIVVPTFIDNDLTGFITLGSKLSGELYNQDELDVISTLSNQAALAIENARFYTELENRQTELFQAEKIASLGKMASGMSHQINNRFHVLSSIAGHLLYNVLPKFKKDSATTEDKQKLVNEIENSLVKIETNAIRGGEIVKTFARYTSPSKEGFRFLIIDDVIANSLDMVQYKVDLDKIDLIEEVPLGLPKLKGDLSQLSDCFFNLIDNAYDAIMRKIGKGVMEEYRGFIRIAAYVGDDGFVRVEVTDNGLGMNSEESKNIFVPFFTTKASSEKGHGLGLYVIKKIIESHNGRIRLVSECEKGTTFYVDIPAVG